MGCVVIEDGVGRGEGGGVHTFPLWSDPQKDLRTKNRKKGKREKGKKGEQMYEHMCLDCESDDDRYQMIGLMQCSLKLICSSVGRRMQVCLLCCGGGIITHGMWKISTFAHSYICTFFPLSFIPIQFAVFW